MKFHLPLLTNQSELRVFSTLSPVAAPHRCFPTPTSGSFFSWSRGTLPANIGRLRSGHVNPQRGQTIRASRCSCLTQIQMLNVHLQPLKLNSNILMFPVHLQQNRVQIRLGFSLYIKDGLTSHLQFVEFEASGTMSEA